MAQRMRRSALGLARMSVVALSAVTFVALAIVVSRHGVPALDRDVQAWVQRTRSAALDPAMELLAFLGSGCVLFTMTFVAYVFLHRARHPLARALPLIALAAFVLLVLTQRLIARPRPNGHSDGFPSGHAFGATVYLGFVVWLVWTSRIRRGWQWAATLGAGLLVLGIAYCRLYLDVHWLTDVAGGLAGGLAYVMSVLAIGRPHR
jgi:membrane-associated phospholipid phosphatase